MANNLGYPWRRALALVAVIFALSVANTIVDQNRTGAQPLPPMTPEEFRKFERDFQRQEVTPEHIEELARHDFLLLDVYLLAFFFASAAIVRLLILKPANSSLFIVAAAFALLAGASGSLSAVSVACLLVVVAATGIYVLAREKQRKAT